MNVYLDDIRRWCADNNRLTACLLSFFERNKYRLVSDCRDAQVMVVNACNITRRQAGIIERCVEAAKANGGRVVVLGCPPWFNKRPAADAGVDLRVFPSGKLKAEPEALGRALGAREPFRWLSMDEVLLKEEIRLPGVEIDPSELCFLKVSSGCNSNCSFCAAPQVHGRVKSEPLDKILADAAQGLRRGRRGFVLVAKDNGCWGRDIGLNLGDLLDALAALAPEARLIVPHLNPAYLPALMPRLRRHRARLSHVTSPIQSGSAKILKAMGREYDIAETLAFVDELRAGGTKAITSVIVGHPGETRADFAATARAVLHFDLVTATRLVVHPGTPAARMTLDVPEPEVQARLRAVERVCARAGIPTMYYDDVRGL